MPKNKTFRLVVDTNLWISFLISNRQRQLDSLLISGKAQLLFSAELLDEINTTAGKSKLRKYFAANAVEEMLFNLEAYIDLVAVKSKINLCRDSKDNFLLALAKDGKADFLLTGDNDLLELHNFGKTKIVTLTNFLAEMK